MPRRSLLVVAAFACTFVACGDSGSGGPEECAAPCFNPPAATCDGDSVLAYNPLGECVDGQCVFQALSPRDCAEDGQVCLEGRCEDPPDPCDGVVCNEPPAAICAPDVDSTRIEYAETGTCVASEDGSTTCEYEELPDDCRRNQQCEGGECVRRPCFDVECTEAPAPSCDGTEIVTYGAEGTCDPEDESCDYPVATRTDCAEGGQFCRNARCVDINPCEGVTCDEPPEAACDEDDVLTVYGFGECNAGECEYRETVTDCTERGEICREGSCRERMPCEDVACDEPPSPYCLADTAVTFAETGTCEDDDCDYTITNTDCTESDEICRAGECVVPGTCDGVVCTDRPANFCRGDVAVRFEVPGICEEGVCRYTETEADCAEDGGFCTAGDCEIADPCEGLDCTVLPAAFCDGTESVSFAFPVECIDSECVFVEFREDCSDEGAACVDGVCEEVVDPCIDVVCDSPPDDFCVGDIRLYYEGLGTCVDGDCEYDDAELEEDCADSDAFCAGGACLPGGEAAARGDLLITELMVRPSDPAHAWFEVWDRTGRGDLSGLIVRNGAGASFTVPDGTLANEVGLVVFGASAGAVPGGVDVVWPGAFSLGTSAGVIELQGREIADRLAYDTASGWLFATDVASGLDYRSTSTGTNDDPALWCDPPVEYTPGSRGTPGATNGACGGPIADGDLVITEIMVDGSARPGGLEQWFEVYNNSGAEVDLGGLFVRNFLHSFVVPDGVTIGVGEYFVFGTDSTVANDPDYEYGIRIEFLPDGDALQLFMGASLVDEVGFAEGPPTWPYATGASMALTRPAVDNGNPANWCEVGPPDDYPGAVTNYGTPGAAGGCD